MQPLKAKMQPWRFWCKNTPLNIFLIIKGCMVELVNTVDYFNTLLIVSYNSDVNRVTS